MTNRIWSALFLISFALSACGPGNRSQIDLETWGGYWFQGQAELNSYDLIQYRYGEARVGEAVLIFVTEDFSKKKQVKLDELKQGSKDGQTVLKMNQTREFVTGIYPYHMMLSVFTPVREHQRAVKLTLSSQEWCGQSFTQLNLKGKGYQGKLFSYFEQEGDDNFSVKGLAEDELWNLIRLGPQQVPLGKVELIPSLIQQRFTKEEWEVSEAEISLEDTEDESLRELKVAYTNGKRILKIRFQSIFPYEIMSWEEISIKTDGSEEITKATRKGSLKLDYWTRTGNEDQVWRDSLNIGK
ncbi:hypothetical protein [Pararhodonellum marinum]|uniref:hypothetical protein n=1 Tax=Pararhodonellum marinum TaxID=2755358 RepID=UPI00188FF3E3|nr:hypothetical protein [Pararhodonellum marinum]